MPIVSIVMSVLNGDRFLSEAVDSILSQTCSEFEFIIINDGSTDKTAALLDSYRSTDDRIRVYHQDNLGLVESLNRGCALASAKYIARMDADDVARPDRLERQVEFLERQPSLALVGGAIVFINSAGVPLRTHHQPISDGEIKASLFRNGGAFWHPTVLMRTEAFRSVGGYRKVVTAAEDYDLWLRMAEKFELANLRDVVLKYRIHPSQVSIRKARQMAISSTAARAAAILRKAGRPDPLASVPEITPEVMAQLGVSQAAQSDAFAKRYTFCIGDMLDIGEYGKAGDALETLWHSPEIQNTSRHLVADIHLLAAQLYWRQHAYKRSVMSAVTAVVSRPVILGRPLKSLFRQLRGFWPSIENQQVDHCGA
jgi:hypothetical protein